METLWEFVAPKTFNGISYVAVIFWILCEVILFGIFGEMENSDFRCVAESDKVDLVRGKCSELSTRNNTTNLVFLSMAS